MSLQPCCKLTKVVTPKALQLDNPAVGNHFRLAVCNQHVVLKPAAADLSIIEARLQGHNHTSLKKLLLRNLPGNAGILVNLKADAVAQGVGHDPLCL